VLLHLLNIPITTDSGPSLSLVKDIIDLWDLIEKAGPKLDLARKDHPVIWTIVNARLLASITTTAVRAWVASTVVVLGPAAEDLTRQVAGAFPCLAVR